MTDYARLYDNLDATAGRAVGALIGHQKEPAETIAHKLEIRARILRDMAPAVGIAGPGIPVMRQRNCEMAADNLDAAAACIRRLGSFIPKTALDVLHEEVAKAARRFVNAEAEGNNALIEDAYFGLLRAVTTLNEATA